MEQRLSVGSGLLARRRIGNRHAGQIDAQLGGLRLDLRLRAHEGDLRQTQLHDLRRRLHGTRLAALRQHHMLDVRSRFGSDFVNDRHL